MSAPDRIWATGNEKSGSWNDTVAPEAWGAQCAEYVRADLCTPTQDERVRALVDAAERLADLWDKDATDRIGPATRQMRAALRALEQGEG